MIPFVMIELDKPRKMRFGMGVILEFEQMTGRKVQEFEDEMSFKDMIDLLFVMFKQEDPDITREKIVSIIDEYAPNIPYVDGKINESISAAFPKPKENSKNG